MSFETVRQAVNTHIATGLATGLPTIPVEFENIDDIDHNTRSEPFITFAFKYRDSRQASVELNPLTRYEGEGQFHAHIPQGRGTAPYLAIADVIRPLMEYKNVSGVQFLSVRLLEPGTIKGWHITPIFVSFFYTN